MDIRYIGVDETKVNAAWKKVSQDQETDVSALVAAIKEIRAEGLDSKNGRTERQIVNDRIRWIKEQSETQPSKLKDLIDKAIAKLETRS